MKVKWLILFLLVALSISDITEVEYSYATDKIKGTRQERIEYETNNISQLSETEVGIAGRGFVDPDRLISITLVVRTPLEFVEIEKSLLISPAPNELGNNYDFRVNIISRNGRLLGSHGFDDPRLRREEVSHGGLAKLEEVEFDLIIPLYYEIDRAEIHKKDSGELLHVIDLQKFFIHRE